MRIFDELGVEGPPLSGANLGGDFAIGLLGPAGGRVTVPSKHAAIAFDPGVLSGPTWVVVAGLSDPPDPGMCPFGFPVDVDCYPLFYDYSVFPETNVTGVPRVGQCVLDEGPLAPPSEAVAMRLRIASESEDDPGTLVFWPLTEAPSTVDCTDLEEPVIVGWQGTLFEAMGPLAGLFRVTPAYANPGKLGASISSFSPFAPADPESGGSEEEPPPPEDVEGVIEGVVVNSFEQPVAGQVVNLRRVGGGLTDQTVTGPDGTFKFSGLPIDPEGTDYQVRAVSGQGSDSERVTLTEEEPEKFVVLVVPGGGDSIEF